ncbi:MAG TPA: aminotransferase class V-fold PLP-dependent enzyme [Candidatus Acidoferrum sp.]|jgi:selenocysteine lyase/cysteine desulfurase
MLTPARVKEIRARFPVFREKIYLNSCSQGALSDSVRAGVDAYTASWDRYGSPWDIWVDEYEKARAGFAKFLGAKMDEVAVLPSASAGINSIASALNFNERKKVVLGAFEFPTMGHVWLAQQTRGAQVEFVEATGDRMPAENYERAVDRSTLIVPVTGLCFMNGWRSEVKKLVALAHSRGALLMLDDYQDCGTRPVDVKDLDVDIYVSGTLKYLLGPPGLAMMYVKPELAKTLAPTISGWFAQTNPFAFDVRTLDLSPTARRFEAGTPAIPNIYAAIKGVELLQEIGLDEVAGQIAHLTAQLLSGVQNLGIQTKTPADSVGPLTVLKCKDSEALVAKLAAQGIVVSNRKDGLRIAFHVYNTGDDVEAVLDALKKNLDLLALQQ